MKRLLIAAALPLLLVSPIEADELPERLTVATWNLEWFYDHYTGDNSTEVGRSRSAPSREEWEWKLAGAAEAVARMQPTILALQEVENIRVLYSLARRLRDEHKLAYRVAFIEGIDFGTGQDVGLLYRSGLIEYARRLQTDETYGSKNYYNLSKHLIARFAWGAGDEEERLTLLILHLRARPEAAEIRVRQARLARLWIEDLVRREENVIVLGDLNTEETAPTPAPGSDLAVLLGLTTADAADDLFDLHARLPEAERATHLSGKQYDRMLVSRALLDDAPDRRDLVLQSVRRPRELVVRAEPDGEEHYERFYEIPHAERDLSDHYPLVAEFVAGGDGRGGRPRPDPR